MDNHENIGSRGVMTVAINDVRCFARHGVFAQEQTTGNEFTVSLKVSWLPGVTIEDSLEDTISYADLYEIVIYEMGITSALLETVAQRIAMHVSERWSQIISGHIEITKLTPPISGFTGTASVSYDF